MSPVSASTRGVTWSGSKGKMLEKVNPDGSRISSVTASSPSSSLARNVTGASVMPRREAVPTSSRWFSEREVFSVTALSERASVPSAERNMADSSAEPVKA